jgi:hypothetical protein
MTALARGSVKVERPTGRTTLTADARERHPPPQEGGTQTSSRLLRTPHTAPTRNPMVDIQRIHLT